MGWFRKTQGNGASKPSLPEQCLIVHLRLSESGFGTAEERDSIHNMSEILSETIAIRKTGEFDGDVFGDGHCELFMYGHDADALFETVFPILNGWKAMKGGYVVKRFGPPGSRTEKIEFS